MLVGAKSNLDVLSMGDIYSQLIEYIIYEAISRQ